MKKLKVVGYLDFDTCIIYPNRASLEVARAKEVLTNNAKKASQFLKQVMAVATSGLLVERLGKALSDFKTSKFSYTLRSAMLTAKRLLKAFNNKYKQLVNNI
jgi:hypothetical protein